MPSSHSKDVLVIGAGVVGLTTAIRIQERGGYNVVIVADTLPTDEKSIRYTSHWAGANHISLAGDDDSRQQRIDRETFKVMWELSAPGGEAERYFFRVPQTVYFPEQIRIPKVLELMPDFRYVPEHELPPGAVAGLSFTTVTIDTPEYLKYLHARLLAGGGRLSRGTVQHIDQVLNGGFGRVPAAVVVCAGLGARTLGGVEDQALYPIRGQTVLLKAPWVRAGVSVQSPDERVTYVIPRRSGTVILGGVKGVGDDYPRPRPETTTDILERCLALRPDLAPPDVSAPSINDLRPLVIEEGCGLRPGRRGGIRLETEFFLVSGGKVPVVYNYGHGGAGFQSSWGSASMVLELVQSALEDASAAS